MTEYKDVVSPLRFKKGDWTKEEIDTFLRLLTQYHGELSDMLRNTLDKGISFNDNMDAVSVTFTSSATPDAENTVAHTLGKVPTGFIVYSKDKAGVVYDGTTTFTSTNIYLKCNVASVAIKAWVF